MTTRVDVAKHGSSSHENAAEIEMKKMAGVHYQPNGDQAPYQDDSSDDETSAAQAMLQHPNQRGVDADDVVAELRNVHKTYLLGIGKSKHTMHRQ